MGVGDHETRKSKWVAVRGIEDNWCIYHAYSTNIIPETDWDREPSMFAIHADIDRVRDWGNPLFDMNLVRELVPGEDEIYELYGHRG